jgi:hypothetical protein
MKKKIIEILAYIFLIGLVIGFLFVSINQSRDKTKKVNYEISCDFESLDENGNFITTNNNYKLQNADICDSISFSGKNSIFIANWKEYQNITILPDITEKLRIKINYKKLVGSSAFIVVQGQATKDFYYIADTISSDIINGWYNISIDIIVPDDFSDSVNIYVYNRLKQDTYIDDISISVTSEVIYPEYKNMEPLLIYIQESQMKKLMKLREKALEDGMLTTAEDSYVKAIVYGDNKMMHAEVRLKGDWLDHLAGSKWSFRIKLTEDSWHGMRVFSIQTPFARGYNNEWLFHKICQDQDVLTTKYDYVPVYLNGKSLGIYSYEEHFQKELIEFNHRREGPIVKFSETDFWKLFILSLYSEIGYEASYIEPFSENKMMSDSVQYNYFLLAANLLNMYRDMQASASEIFDIDKTAKFFALINSKNAFHGLQWHNMRFYYNPVLCRLEPIAYDNFSGPTEFSMENPISPMLIINNKLKRENSVYFLMTDSVFVNKYLSYLEYYVKELNYEFYKNKFAEEYKYRDSILRVEFIPYNLDTIQFSKVAVRFAKYIPVFKDSLNNPAYLKKTHNLKNEAFDQSCLVKIYLYADLYVKFFKNSDTRIFVKNFLPYNVRVIGTGDEKSITQSMSIDIIPKDKISITEREIEIPKLNANSTYIYFEVHGIDTVFKTNIIQWPAPVNYNPRNDIASKAVDLGKYTDEKSKTITFSGSLSFSNHIYIPAGYKVIFDPGTSINITNNSAFVSCSAIQMNGTAQAPIKIYSSDKTANGFTILQSPEKCIVNYVTFENLNTMNYKGWLLTGAVTFYESDVDISNTTFTNNHCEDMLNTIRSKFYLKNCTIKNTFGDAHDSDFCTGTLDNCSFSNCANDAIDFSTSDVVIKNCKINGTGDKGISVGENTKAKIISCVIDNVNIGIASKDLSHADITGVKISHAVYGFVLLQKKPEFGPASITATGCEMSDVSTTSLVEKGSVLKLNGVTIISKKPKLFALFYE